MNKNFQNSPQQKQLSMAELTWALNRALVDLGKLKKTGLSKEPIETKLNIKNQFAIVLIWIGLWGLFETILTIFVGENKLKIRIFVYSVTFLVAVFLLQ